MRSASGRPSAEEGLGAGFADAASFRLGAGTGLAEAAAAAPEGAGTSAQAGWPAHNNANATTILTRHPPRRTEASLAHHCGDATRSIAGLDRYCGRGRDGAMDASNDHAPLSAEELERYARHIVLREI